MTDNKSKIQKGQTRELAKTILKGLGLAAMIGGMIVFPGMAPMVGFIEKLASEDSGKARYAFKRMQKQGVVKVTADKSKAKIVLTPKGRRRILRYRLQELHIDKPKRWDGQWYLVMFDVPESRHAIRDLVRRKLLQLGFVSLQKSVFVHPFACDEVIEVLREHYRLVPGQLYVFEARIREGEEILKKHFKLS